MFKIENTVEVIDDSSRNGMIGRVKKCIEFKNGETEYFVRFTMDDEVWIPESSLRIARDDMYLCEFCDLGRPIINTNEEQVYVNGWVLEYDDLKKETGFGFMIEYCPMCGKRVHNWED